MYRVLVQFTWVIVGVIALIALGMLIVFLNRKGKIGKAPDYRVFFILGMAWFPIGIAADNNVFFILGLVYLIIGLANRDKWNPTE